MLDSDYPRSRLAVRYPHLSTAAATDRGVRDELSELLVFAPAVSRAERRETDLTGVLVDADGGGTAVRVFDVSHTGVQLGVPRGHGVTIEALLEATLVIDRGEADPLALSVRFVRVVDDDDDDLFLGFRFTNAQEEVEVLELMATGRAA